MSDEPFFARYRKPPPPEVLTPRELLFQFQRGQDRFRCELREHAGAYGVEAQFYQNEKFLYGRRFDARMDSTRTPRELAVQWAELERKALEKGWA